MRTWKDCALLCLFCGLLASPALAGDVAAPDTYAVGVAVREITPDYPIRLSGFGFRRTESEGVVAPIFARAIAISSDDDSPVVLVAIDSTGIPLSMTQEVARRLAPLGVRPERFALTATHTHTAPMLRGVLPTLFGEPVPSAHQEHIDRYTSELTDHLVEVCRTALQTREPSQLFYGIGEVGFAKNRRQPPGGPVDHDLPVLVVKTPTGKVRAIWATYACHAVTLSHNFIGGDWPGFAADAIERQFPGVAALISIGCGADQNPLSGVTGDKVDVARTQGAELAAEVDRLLKGALRPVSGRLEAQQKTIDLPLAELPEKSHWDELVKKGGYIGYHAQVQLDTLARGEALPTKVTYPVGCWNFGDSLGLVFLPGEVVVDYAHRLKHDFDRQRVWICAYSNDCPCYIPSDRVLNEGGYEGASAMTYYNFPAKFAGGVEQRIIDTVHELLPESLATPLVTPPSSTNPSQTDRPLSPAQSLKRMHVSADFTVQLVASEPLTTDPVAIDFGPDGALWVCEMHDYPMGGGGNYEAGGRVRVLRDDNGDGIYDRSTIFLDGLPFPTGVTVWKTGVLICAAPDIIFAADTDGDDRADMREALFSGFGTGNYQARVNSLTYGIDGWVYGSCGLFGGEILSHRTGQTVALGDRDFRIDPDRGILEPLTGRTQQSRVRNDAGDWFGCTNGQTVLHYPVLESASIAGLDVPPLTVSVSNADARQLHPRLDGYQRFKLSGPAGQVTAACGLGIYRDDWLGPAFQNNAVVCEPVNLVVHREVLTANGVTFTGQRAPEEIESELLTSTDNWFRPAQVRTGPDGGLWVVDMSRAVIEHPRWIPEDIRAQLDVRAGDQQGRIYRILPKDRGTRPVIRWEDMSAQQLVESLRSPNGVVRDLAQQLLLWNDEQTVAEDLATLATSDAPPSSRIAAIWILARWDRLDPLVLDAALVSQEPLVRRHAAEILGAYPSRVPQASEWFNRLAEEPEPTVILAATNALRSFPKASATPLLAGWLTRFGADPWLRFSILRAVPTEAWGDFVTRVISEEDDLPEGLWLSLIKLCGAKNDPAAWQVLWMRVMPEKPGAEPLSWTVLERMAMDMGSGAAQSSGRLDREKLSRWHAFLDAVRQEFDDPSCADERRVVLAGVLTASNPADRERLLNRLTPQSSLALQVRLVDVLLRTNDLTTAEELLSRWNTLTPGARGILLDRLLLRPAQTELLVAALESQAVSANSIDAQRRQMLLTHRQPAIAERAKRLFGELTTARAEVIAQHRSVLTLTGDSQRGQAIYAKRCAACHAWNGQGHAVGPDLGESRNKTWSALMTSILDPNQAVDQRYAVFIANLEDGRTVQGVLAAETDTSLTLKGQEAKLTTLERRAIEELVISGRSLMPEGLEKDLSPQDFADICALITQRTVSGEASRVNMASIAAQILDESQTREAREQLIAEHAGHSAELIGALVTGLGTDAKEEYRRIPWIWRVAIAAGKRNETDELRTILRTTLPEVGTPLTDWQAVVIGGGIINGITQAGSWPHERLAEIRGNDADLRGRLEHALKEAAEMSGRESTPTGTRYDALRMIAMEGWSRGGAQLVKYLPADAHSELQMGAVSGLADIPETPATAALIEHLKGLSSRNQALALDGLLRSDDRMLALLTAVAAGKVSADLLGEQRQTRLLEATSAQVRQQAQRVLRR